MNVSTDARHGFRETPTAGTNGRKGPGWRILLLEANTDGTTGGSHRALFDLVRTLERERFTPVVAFYQDNPYVARLRHLGVEVFLLEQMYARELEVYHREPEWREALEKARAVARRVKLLVAHDIDLVHINNSPTVAFMDWMPAAKLTGLPVVSGAMGTGESIYYDRPICRWLMNRFDRILAVSEHTAATLEEAGLDPSPITVVHHGVDIDGLRESVTRGREATRKELELEEDVLLVTMIANVREWKGQHLLLEAAGMVTPELRHRLRIAFAGGIRQQDEGYRDRLWQLVVEQGLEHQVRFLGFRDDVPDLLVASDIVVHASIQPEPGGIAVLEAMALGRPVIAADSGGHAEAVTEGCGRLFETGSAAALACALEEVASDRELRDRLGTEAAKQMRSYSLERNARATEAVYESLLSR